MKYHITTYGCQMNVHESEKLAGMLENLGYENTETQIDADVLVFNTCAIREGAQHRVFGNVGALKQMKKENKNKIIAVCGCMTQQDEVAQKLYKTFPFVDIIFGTHNFPDFELYLKKFLADRERILKVEEQRDICEYTSLVRTSGTNAWVDIMYGCDNFCTYCIVPYVRGRERSRDKQDILNEVARLAKNPAYETITLLGQNVNSYGNDSPEKNKNFANLLKEICAIEGDFKLTFMTSNPKDLTDEVISTIATQPKIIKDIHLPVQSGSNRILKLMNRKYTKESYLEIIRKIRLLMPNAKITTDFIVGFPTETEEDFNQTCELVKEVGFNSIFAYMYSKRPNTPAASMLEQIDIKEKRRRVNELLDLERELKNKRKGVV
jgi:tRNA-2-methylthio-N6-dimethylallyladenosine synthase